MLKDIEERPDFSFTTAFNTVDRYGEGSINMANLQDFLRTFGCYMIERELFAAIRRVDTDGDAKISFDEFKDFFVNQINKEAHMLKMLAATEINGQKKKRK